MMIDEETKESSDETPLDPITGPRPEPRIQKKYVSPAIRSTKPSRPVITPKAELKVASSQPTVVMVRNERAGAMETTTSHMDENGERVNFCLAGHAMSEIPFVVWETPEVQALVRRRHIRRIQ